VARLALAFAALGLVAVLVAAPGQYVAMGLGIAAVGAGRIAYQRRTAPGMHRLAGAAAMTMGGMSLLLGAVRVALALAALSHLERLLG
jgi:hypothetical protein